MSSFLSSVRQSGQKQPISKQWIHTISILALGVLLGIVSKYLDCVPSNELPFIINALDVRNFLGRFSLWIFLSVCISVYSRSPMRAAVNVFVFLAGMVASYYWYSAFVAGFFPWKYAMIWAALTVLSPLLASICWYAKGNGMAAMVLSSVILAVLFHCAFSYGFLYLDVISPLDLAVFLLGLILLGRRPREMALLAAMGIAFIVILNCLWMGASPF